MYASQQAERFQLRLPDGLRERIKEMAAQNKRSMNSEILFHLEPVAYDQLQMKTAPHQA
jgi:predicted HicB family RNase H-like nuclease